jgi:6-phosphogluconolactonase (cycloisomerase 2 family)
MSELLIGCYTPPHGRGTGISVPGGHVIPTPSPSFVIRHPHLPVIYAVGEEAHGTVSAWSLGDWTPMGSGETGGADPCHLTVDGDSLISVNYSGGNVSVHALGADGRILERTDLVAHDRAGDHDRQDGPHPHMVHASDDGLAVTDLGGDGIYLYHREQGKLVLDRIVDTPAGAGPRNVARVGDQWLVTAELSGELLVYASDWTYVGAEPTTRSPGHNDVSELAAGGGYVYVANRGPDTIGVFALGDGLPTYVTEVPTGRNPRQITLHTAPDGTRTLYVANQGDDTVSVMPIADGVPVLAESIATPSPTCVVVL